MDIKKYVAPVALLAALVGMGACSSAPPTIQSGPDAETTFDGLTLVDNTKMAKVWARSDIDLNGYTKLLPVITNVTYATVRHENTQMARRTNQENFALSDKEKQNFETSAAEVIAEEFAKSQKFTITDQPGEGVLVVRVEILDVASKVPADDFPGRQQVYVRTIGDAGLVLELYDAESKQILARAVDRQEFSYPGDQMRLSSPFMNAAQVKNGLSRWASRLVQGLDSLKTN